MQRTEDSLRDLWDNIKCTNIQIIGVSEEEQKKKAYEKIFEEITVENVPTWKRKPQKPYVKKKKKRKKGRGNTVQMKQHTRKQKSKQMKRKRQTA